MPSEVDVLEKTCSGLVPDVDPGLDLTTEEIAATTTAAAAQAEQCRWMGLGCYAGGSSGCGSCCWCGVVCVSGAGGEVTRVELLS